MRCHLTWQRKSPGLSFLNSPAGLQLLSRPDCPLCEEFAEQIARFGLEMPLPPITWVDVDSDPQLARRYGLDVPVLLLDGLKVCQHHFDPDELRRLLRPR
ncbi:MAG: glutaredoxin family protein [Steroidobacteraceae bacterium]